MTIHPERRSQDAMLGRVLLGRYRIVRELARGGMGIVYLARAEGAEGFVRPVVVKLILREYADDERFLQMFAREAKILASLRDPSIVDVLEFGEDGGDYVMVLEYVRGYHLGQWKRYLTSVNRTIPTAIMVQIGIDILTALHHAHMAKHPDGRPMHITHRDVSPSNILLDSSGRPRLLDFGVARMRGGTHAYKTQVKSVVGKAPYLSPELLAGEDASAQSDLYACAVVIHETLFGKNVFRGDNEAMTLYRVLHHTPEPVSQGRTDAPEGLDEVLAKALAKQPSDRYKTADEFARALRTLLSDAEHDVRDALAALLEVDFREEMAKTLGIESLSTRDDAWSRASQMPEADDRSPRSESRSTDDGETNPDPTAGVRPTDMRRKSRIPPPPPAVKLPPMPSGEGQPQPVASQPVTGSGRAAWIVAGVVAIAALGLGAQAILSRPDTTKPAANAGPIQVVQQALPDETAPLAEPAPEVEPEVGLEEDAGEVAPDPETPRSHRRPSRPKTAVKRSGPDAAALTRAFRRKQGAVQHCFTTHGNDAVNQARVEVEFSIDAKGGLQRSRVLPRSIAGTALGQCVAKVADSTHFPAQGQPVTFAIPVTARAVR